MVVSVSGVAADPPVQAGLFPLPGGFGPDAVPFALRFTLALLLAYGVSFAIQLDSASSAGLCVAIVAQASPGMVLSKAAWRTAGTLLGGVAGIVLVAAFSQNRTMLLGVFTLWLGGCTFLAAWLRDFRSYGAVLAGYTVGIVAVGNIDTPDQAFLSALNRVAAILIGVLSMAAVNTALAPPGSFLRVVEELDRWKARVDGIAEDALHGRAVPGSTELAAHGAAILALRSEAGYASLELPGGGGRRRAAASAIAGLLGVLSAARGLAASRQQPDSPARDAFAAERRAELARQRALAADGLAGLREGRAPKDVVRLGLYQDVVGYWLNAVRTMVATGLGCAFCVVAGWPGATLLLIQQAAFTALFGMQPNPTGLAVGTAVTLPFAAAATFVIGFLLLPQASGFFLFALALAPFAFAFALVGRHRKGAGYGPGLMLYLTLLLAPANTEAFDLAGFSNNVFVQAVAVAFMVGAFEFILPVAPGRRLMRVVDSAGRDLRRTLAGRPAMRPIVTARSLRYDRLAVAQVWLGRRTPARLRVLDRLCRFAELDGALLRAAHGLRELRLPMPARTPDALAGAADAILAAGNTGTAVELAVSGLHEAAVLLRTEERALRRYGVAGHVA